jgi:hypothetical protein
MTTFSDLRERARQILADSVHDPIATSALLYDLIARLDEEERSRLQTRDDATRRSIGLQR